VTVRCAGRLGLEADSGWLTGVRRLLSPNQDERPVGTAVDLLVVHNISLPPGQFGGSHVDELFTNTLDPDAHPYFRGLQGLRVSAHLLVARDGVVTQYVPLHRRAWHAGVSEFRGRPRCNDFSVGIELEGTDDRSYEDRQYELLVDLVRLIAGRWPAITPDRVVGHSDVAPGRKTDPGPAFDWPRLRARLAAGD
jgi:AmpD protein